MSNFKKLEDILPIDVPFDECIENKRVYVDIQITAHFGNAVSLVIRDNDGRSYIDLYNSTNNIGHILKELIELLGIEEEDGLLLSKMVDIPIRLVYDASDFNKRKVIAIGHFLYDRFIAVEDLINAKVNC